ncbi:MAG: flagellar hook protein FlgE [Sphingomonas oligoaromativorans]|jgi:flagellar hook protein FlgE|uniref:flagellar hook protein FlgE n=1 Tax=Sphingomonas oligoaromativorans TaxID=575322 RepID=UPI00141F8975|nr:flagellar hook protein FlgE [Sphingomonas oligoaromativorans]NIJ31969.1 flagellar hook protein FlgE [Sphingomonas oligoaromativorans]
MSFYTSLSGLNAAQTNLNVTSNNIANVGTVGFKASYAQFGDLISSSPQQAASSVIGSGTKLKGVTQQFSQGSQETTSQTLDLMLSGGGFFITKSAGTGAQVSYTRNGSFSPLGNGDVVDSNGNNVQVLPVDPLGNVTATGLGALQSLHIPATNGSPKATSQMDLSMTFPSDADLPADRSVYTASEPYKFDPKDPNSYNNATSMTVYDSAGNAIPATVYYVRDTAPAADGSTTTSDWTAHMYVGDKEVFPAGATPADTPLKLTFDENGVMTAPNPSNTAYDSVSPTGAVAPLTISVDYGSATKQGAYAFSAVSSYQDGSTTGKFSTLAIDEKGLVTASYSDGSTIALGKIAVANFNNPSGLHQVGNTTWTASGTSGDPEIGEAGSDGRGTISSGELEMSNVDLTTELVNLISAQRDFQANAKAIDTDKQMISSILNMQ